MQLVEGDVEEVEHGATLEAGEAGDGAIGAREILEEWAVCQSEGSEILVPVQVQGSQLGEGEILGKTTKLIHVEVEFLQVAERVESAHECVHVGDVVLAELEDFKQVQILDALKLRDPVEREIEISEPSQLRQALYDRYLVLPQIQILELVQLLEVFDAVQLVYRQVQDLQPAATILSTPWCCEHQRMYLLQKIVRENKLKQIGASSCDGCINLRYLVHG